MFNHSCAPNAASHFRKDMISMTVAIEDISCGSEICICYKSIVLFLPTQRRQDLLQQNWGFKCTCNRCISPLPSDTFLTSGNMTARQASEMSALYDQLMSKHVVNDYESADQWMSKAKELLDLDLHPAHWRKISIRREMIYFLQNPHFSRRDLKRILEAQIKAFHLIAPKLHNCKIELYVPYRDLIGESQQWSPSIELQLSKLDSYFTVVKDLFNK
eukprot:TRINITY_DN4697_c0_g1_i3.p1 TRINITY_DN4697_c0_g1~~TRINITY_DN4697_c0_g1_i3.p1  ORF type:complete len:216 (+),score=30.20 TRINITY_DN4697_c0_g1_i3:527-1174(+)